MSNIELEKIFYTIQIDLQVEAANIAALVFPQTDFGLIVRKIGSFHAALVLPKTQYQSLSQEIGNDNLAIIFKSQKQAFENFQVNFFPKIDTLTLSRYCKDEMIHLRYYPANNYDWFNSRGTKIARPDYIGQKFEFLANKFYPFLEEFFLG